VISDPRLDRWVGRVKRRRQLLGLTWCRCVSLYGCAASGGGTAGGDDDDDIVEDDW